MRRARVVLALLVSTSCAYYNGLYNANALAHRAEKAERDGRRFEARSLWGEVAVKAETVLARHPRSKWAPEAHYLQGKALERTGDCAGAVAPLERAVRTAAPELADDAALRLSTCKATLGDVQGAGLAAERLLQSPDPARRAEAGWRAGTAYRRAGRSQEAVATLRASGHPNARGELAAALADAGEVDAAVALADSLLAAHDSIAPWSDILVAVGRRDTLTGSALLDRVIAGLAPPHDTAATWLAADAVRLLPKEESRGLARFEAAYRTAPGSAPGVNARITALRYRLGRADTPDLLDSIPVLLDDVEPSAGESQVRARELVAAARSARAQLDSLDPLAPQADLHGLLLGETLRDSLSSPRLAVNLWRRVLVARGDSPYAPKLLLALAALEPAAADSIRQLLETQYAASPYVLALHGGDDAGYRVLEDSLARFSVRARTPVRPPVRGRRPAAAPTGRIDP